MSTTDADVRNNNRVHTIYKTSRGVRVPSVTTVLRVLAKPALIPWAHGLGLKGIDLKGYVDELAGIGTLTHRMILDHLRGDKTDTAAYSADQIDLAENCFIKYLAWEKAHAIEPVLVETPLVSEMNLYGGTPDFLGYVDGELTLIDFKTGKGIYDDYWYQLGGYYELIEETHADMDPITSFRILNIGRSADEKFVEETRDDLADEVEVFIHALAIYMLTRGN